MGAGDQSVKMRRRVSQNKKKARVARQIAEAMGGTDTKESSTKKK